jgi:hypothetical protein
VFLHLLKQAYGSLIEQRIRDGYNHIDKLDFLEAFPEARIEASVPETIQNGFAGTGIYPYDSDHVIDQLRIQLKTPTPPGCGGSGNSQSSYIF